MRRYLHIALAIGGGAAFAAALATLMGGFERPNSWLAERYRSVGWIDPSEGARLLWLEWVALTVLALAAARWTVELTEPTQKILIACGVIAIAPGLSLSLAVYGFYFAPFAPMAAALLGAVGAGIFGLTERGGRKRVLERLLGTRVSRRRFLELLEAEEAPSFFARRSEVAVLSCRLLESDAWGAFEPAERVACADLFARLVGDLLLARGACVERCGPGLVQASFGLLEDGDANSEPGTSAAAACAVALELRGRFATFRRECESRWLAGPQCGAGLSVGTLSLGVCTGRDGPVFTATGPEREFSDRLALANARHGSEVLCDAATYRLASERFEFRPLEMVYDPERREMLEVYEPLAATADFSDEDRARRDAFWKGLVLLRGGGYEEALEKFGQARSGAREDQPLERLVSRAQAALAGDEEKGAGRHRLVEGQGGHARHIDWL